MFALQYVFYYSMRIVVNKKIIFNANYSYINCGGKMIRINMYNTIIIEF